MTDAERLDHINLTYRNVFKGEDGQAVLTDILNDCGFFSLEDLEDRADIARLNVAKRILGKCGTWEPCQIADLTKLLTEERKPRGFIRKLFKLPIPVRSNR